MHAIEQIATELLRPDGAQSFSVFVCACAVALLVLGSLRDDSTVAMLVGDTVQTFALVAGAILFALATLGCWVAWHEHKGGLIAYAACMAALVIFEIIEASLNFVKRNRVRRLRIGTAALRFRLSSTLP